MAKAKTGITGFHYAKLLQDNLKGVEYSEIKSVVGSQNVGIETEQSIEKSYGDNRVMEMAVSTGTTTVTMGFHALPLEVRQDLLGLEEDEDGLIIQKSTVTPPDVAMILELTDEDGNSEMVGLTKGKFMLPGVEGQTKEDGVEFQNAEIEGEFASRVYDDVAQVIAEVAKDDAELRQKFMDKVFLNSEGL